MFNKSLFFSLCLGLLSAISAILLLGFSGYFLGSIALSLLFFPLWLFPLLAIFRTVFKYLERIFSHHYALSYLVKIRVEIFSALTKKIAKLEKNSAQFLQRLSADVELLNNFPLRFFLPFFCSLSLLILWLIVAICLNLANIFLIFTLLIAGIFIPCLGIYFSKQSALKFALQNERRREELLKSLYALPALLSWGTWEQEIKKFFKENKKFQKLENDLAKIAINIQFFQQLSFYLAFLILLYSQRNQDLKILLLAFFSLLAYSQFALALTEKPEAFFLDLTGKKRIEGLAVKAEEEIKREEKEVFLKVKNLGLKMENALTPLKNINFALKKGDFLAIYGKSGIGKSSILKAINSELKILEGEIEKSGKILYLSQEIDIFNDSLLENLCLGEGFTEEKILEVLKLVELQDLSLSTQLGEYGAEISGGQAKRIALARLLLRDFDILLLDEPFSGVDEETKNLIVKNLEKFLGAEKICVAVAHEEILGWNNLIISN